jgi:hypothetical protein
MYISTVLLSGSHPIIYNIFLSFALARLRLHIKGAVFEGTAGYWNSFRTF